MKRVKIDEINLNYIDSGTGKPIVFLHGFPMNHTMWESQIEHYCHKYRVIAPDLRGFGKSDVTPQTVTMQQFAEDLSKFLKALSISEPVILCGFSMGGYIAWQFAKQYPKALAQLILCDTKATADTQAAAAGREQTAQRVLKEGPTFLAETMSAKLFSETTRNEFPDVITRVKQMIQETSPEGIAAALRGMASRPDMTSFLPEISAPTLLVCGDEDLLTTPREMRSVADAIPNASFALIKEAGHMAPMEMPELVNAAIDRFLE
ncbi:Hydrolase, alpha/beta fold family [hydrothermal vent metagenome]|uniref:Hydrolase, alpha/beta fold family n=1 Tax=hydrothermal vent metagenome TaxID=652676 RepID=A0A3B1E3U5_9ZZZZ